jgi:hypothetical protein
MSDFSVSRELGNALAKIGVHSVSGSQCAAVEDLMNVHRWSAQKAIAHVVAKVKAGAFDGSFYSAVGGQYNP